MLDSLNSSPLSSNESSNSKWSTKMKVTGDAEDDDDEADDFDQNEDREQDEDEDEQLELDMDDVEDKINDPEAADPDLDEPTDQNHPTPNKQQPTAADSNSPNVDLLYCKICNKLFDNLHRLQRHMMCHDMNPELRKFRCDYCNKAFKFKHHLKVRPNPKFHPVSVFFLSV